MSEEGNYTILSPIELNIKQWNTIYQGLQIKLSRKSKDKKLLKSLEEAYQALAVYNYLYDMLVSRKFDNPFTCEFCGRTDSAGIQLCCGHRFHQDCFVRDVNYSCTICHRYIRPSTERIKNKKLKKQLDFWVKEIVEGYCVLFI